MMKSLSSDDMMKKSKLIRWIWAVMVGIALLFISVAIAFSDALLLGGANAWH